MHVSVSVYDLVGDLCLGARTQLNVTLWESWTPGRGRLLGQRIWRVGTSSEDF
jgi:hypothetical protein